MAYNQFTGLRTCDLCGEKMGNQTPNIFRFTTKDVCAKCQDLNQEANPKRFITKQRLITGLAILFGLALVAWLIWGIVRFGIG
jgi:rRNA maturation protein Nop10